MWNARLSFIRRWSRRARCLRISSPKSKPRCATRATRRSTAMPWVPDLREDVQAGEHCRLELHAAGRCDVDLAVWALKWGDRLGEFLINAESVSASAGEELREAQTAANVAENKVGDMRDALLDGCDKLDAAIKVLEEISEEMDKASR